MKNKDFAIQLGSSTVLAFVDGQLYIDSEDSQGNQIADDIPPKLAREMKSLIDMYLYSLYVTEANI